MIKLMFVFGTRPEAIKMAPIIKAAEQDKAFQPIVVITSQHKEMLEQVLHTFAIVPDYNLNIMKSSQTLTDITANVLEGMAPILTKEQPDLVLVHGDTTTSFAAALSSFYQKITIGHIEAGLRTGKKYSPFPEEMNRLLIDTLCDLYFAPTEQSKLNLLKENYAEENIYITGNTAIDALNYTIDKQYTSPFLKPNKQNIILTTHRRENIGEPMKNIYEAINQVVAEFPDIQVILPIHKNPEVRKLANQTLRQTEQITVIEPLDVLEFHNLAKDCYFIMTDSGGIQEEAPSLDIPVLVLREETERPEGVTAGVLKFVGTDTTTVYHEMKNLLEDDSAYQQMATGTNPFGDGKASLRILDIIKRYM